MNEYINKTYNVTEIEQNIIVGSILGMEVLHYMAEVKMLTTESMAVMHKYHIDYGNVKNYLD